MAVIRVKQGGEIISLSLDFLGLLLLVSEFAALGALAAYGSGADQAGCVACLPLLTAVGYIVTDQRQSAWRQLFTGGSSIESSPPRRMWRVCGEWCFRRQMKSGSEI